MAYQKPYTFRAGTYAKAAEVNANFDTVKNFVDDLDTRITEGLSSSAAYNKANTNGNPSQVFQAAQGSGNNDVVINSQLTSIDGRVAALESQGSWTPPNYSTYTEITGSGTFASDGALFVRNRISGVSYSVTIGGTEMLVGGTSQMMVPIKSGTSYIVNDSLTAWFFAS